jgi:hypothetical protein
MMTLRKELAAYMVRIAPVACQPRKARYRVVHVRQIHCLVVFLPLDTGMSWLTIHKIGYHGVVDREDPSEQV